jgi:hypothetical protein
MPESPAHYDFLAPLCVPRGFTVAPASDRCDLHASLGAPSHPPTIECVKRPRSPSRRAQLPRCTAFPSFPLRPCLRPASASPPVPPSWTGCRRVCPRWWPPTVAALVVTTVHAGLTEAARGSSCRTPTPPLASASRPPRRYLASRDIVFNLPLPLTNIPIPPQNPSQETFRCIPPASPQLASYEAPACSCMSPRCGILTHRLASTAAPCTHSSHYPAPQPTLLHRASTHPTLPPTLPPSPRPLLSLVR